VVNADAIYLLEKFVPPGSVHTTCVFFPDPWAGDRDECRRMVREQVVRLLAAATAVGGRLHIATDVEEYALWCTQVPAATPGPGLLLSIFLMLALDTCSASAVQSWCATTLPTALMRTRGAGDGAHGVGGGAAVARLQRPRGLVGGTARVAAAHCVRAARRGAAGASHLRPVVRAMLGLRSPVLGWSVA
jgi:hypothetical protein